MAAMQSCPTLRGSGAALRGQSLRSPQLQPAARPPLLPLRATLEADSPASSEAGAAPNAGKGLSSRVNLIPQSRWPNGIPPVMGSHLMASGIVSPVSTSKALGRDPDAFKFYYPSDEPGESAVLQFVNAPAAAAGLAALLADASARAVQARGAFTVALSGGSLMEALAPLAGRKDVAFDKWHVVWVDERNVPLDSADSNYAAASSFLERSGIPADQVISLKPGMPVDLAATHYAGRLLDLPERVLPRNSDGYPVLDAVLLGVGPDGHVASLFPNRDELAAEGAWVLPVSGSPKPPAERITLSLPVLNAAADVFFVALGPNKADVVQRALEVQALPGALPAQLVRPAGGRVTWLLDGESAAELAVQEWQNGKVFPRSSLGKGKAQ